MSEVTVWYLQATTAGELIAATDPDIATVVVNTCSLDHPGALANYQARGMRIFKTDTRAG